MPKKVKQDTISAEEALLLQQMASLKLRKTDCKYETLNLISKWEKAMDKVDVLEHDQLILAKKLTRNYKKWSRSQQTHNNLTINSLIELIDQFSRDKIEHRNEITNLNEELSRVEEQTLKTLNEIQDYETNKKEEIISQNETIGRLESEYDEMIHSFSQVSKLIKDFSVAETKDLISTVTKTVEETAERTTERISSSSGTDLRSQILDKIWLEDMVEQQSRAERSLKEETRLKQLEVTHLSRQRSAGYGFLHNCSYIFQLTDPVLEADLEAIDPLCGDVEEIRKQSCPAVEKAEEGNNETTDWPVTEEMILSI